jgi:hypothetical protein
VLAGSQYPADFPWASNVWYLAHLPPGDHPAFYASSRLTLNITRGAMAAMGWCPSGRVFEAAACGVPVLTDWWEGFDAFYAPGAEMLVARTTDEALAALALATRSSRRWPGAPASARSPSTRPTGAPPSWSRRSRASARPRPPRRPRSRRSPRPRPNAVWGIVPAAGAGTRIQPLAFSKELLPVGSRVENGVERRAR